MIELLQKEKSLSRLDAYRSRARRQFPQQSLVVHPHDQFNLILQP
jgi:hypothetical protein